MVWIDLRSVDRRCSRRCKVIRGGGLYFGCNLFCNPYRTPHLRGFSVKGSEILERAHDAAMQEMAERMGAFAFQDRYLQPLGHPSGFDIKRTFSPDSP